MAGGGRRAGPGGRALRDSRYRIERILVQFQQLRRCLQRLDETGCAWCDHSHASWNAATTPSPRYPPAADSAAPTPCGATSPARGESHPTSTAGPSASPNPTPALQDGPGIRQDTMAAPSIAHSPDVLNYRRQGVPVAPAQRRPPGTPAMEAWCRPCSGQCCLPAPTQRNPRHSQHVAEGKCGQSLGQGRAIATADARPCTWPRTPMLHLPLARAAYSIGAGRRFARGFDRDPRARSPIWAIWHGHYPSWSRRRVR